MDVEGEMNVDELADIETEMELINTHFGEASEQILAHPPADVVITPEDKKNAFDEVTKTYYGKVEHIRRLAPRLASHSARRGTCAVGFPTDIFLNQVLYREGRVPRDYMYFRRIVLVYDTGLKKWIVADTLEPYEYALLKYAIQNGIPILGTIHIKLSDAMGHEIGFLMRSVSDLEVFLFETYDTTSTKRMGGNRQWADAIGIFFLETYNSQDYNQLIDIDRHRELIPRTFSVVPAGVNLQINEGSYGLCIMWSLIFLSYLRDLPPATLTHGSLEYLRSKVYKPIFETLAGKDGMAVLMSRVYGTAGGVRRKTRRNRVGASHNVRRKTTKKGVSRFRRSFRSGLKHRRRRV